MHWSDARNYPYQSGRLFLGHADGQEVGIETERHAITIAGAGSGKGTSVIIPNLLKWPHNALVIDPKGEAAEATAEKREAMGQAVHVLDPFGSARVPDRFKASYNPLDDLDPDALTIREDIEAVSDGIVMRPDPQAAHWDDGAQSIISGLIAFVLTTAPDDQRNLVEVQKILIDDDALAEAMQQMKGMDECAGLCREAYSAAFAKEGAYFISNARKNTRWLSSHGMAETLASSSFSLADLKAGRASVYLVLPANYLSQHGRFLRLFVRCGIEAMARKLPSGELRGAQCLFMLDEFFSLGYIDEIAKAAGLMRGYGLQLWPILQDLGQLVTLYGREGSETFFANADVHQFFGNTDTLTLEQISARLGVKDMGEVPLPPAAPSMVHTGFGEGLGVMSGQSKKAAYKVTGQALGGAISLAEKLHSAKAQSRYQDDMNHYQRYMAEHGRPRLNPDQVSNLIRKKDDVVADHMISFVFGREPLLLKPAPYFRALETPPLAAASQAPAAPAFHVKRSEIVALAILVPFWAGGAWLGWAVYGGWLGLFGGVALGVGVSFALDYFGFLGSSDDD
ncbi:type IV secretory system conjugative DNA transfer family protein [Aliiroseovarius sp. S253]|uniref:type IV secretory system conjugative DNA transfer family protein n=1 Tax=Aliiroseovarius sp. S253 TaxID=3415133 RepID=UPI003C7C734A